MQARYYLPMYGRFASPDPARDQHFEDTQSWNIYSYVRNNPVMMTDPTGEIADIAVKGNTVTIRIPVVFGRGTSDARKQEFVNSVQSRWSGKFGGYNVNTSVDIGGKVDGKTNQVFFYDTEGRSSVDARTSDRAFIFTKEMVDGNPANMVDNPNTANVEAHEAGHLMGIADGYKDVEKPDGRTSAIPLDKRDQAGADPNAKGKRSQGDIMVNEKGKPTGADIKEAIQNEKVNRVRREDR